VLLFRATQNPSRVPTNDVVRSRKRDRACRGEVGELKPTPDGQGEERKRGIIEQQQLEIGVVTLKRGRRNKKDKSQAHLLGKR